MQHGSPLRNDYKIEFKRRKPIMQAKVTIRQTEDQVTRYLKGASVDFYAAAPPLIFTVERFGGCPLHHDCESTHATCVVVCSRQPDYYDYYTVEVCAGFIKVFGLDKNENIFDAAKLENTLATGSHSVKIADEPGYKEHVIDYVKTLKNALPTDSPKYKNIYKRMLELDPYVTVILTRNGHDILLQWMPFHMLKWQVVAVYETDYTIVPSCYSWTEEDPSENIMDEIFALSNLSLVDSCDVANVDQWVASRFEHHFQSAVTL